MPARNLKTMNYQNSKSAIRPHGAVLYARVSSKDQEKEGFSIPAQQRLLRDYAIKQGFTVVREFVDVETAKQAGRPEFAAMLGHLSTNQATCATILVEKTDRLYRNLKDWTTLEDLGVNIHLVKENRIIGPESGSSDQLMHGFNVLIARNYVLNLGEETRKGMTEKAGSGVYPSCAPVGYRNAAGPAGKRIIMPDPDTAPIIALVFERFASGNCSLKQLAAQLNAEGVKLRGHRFHRSTLHQILRKRLYSGDFDWNGTTYAGTHELLVTRELWQHVQELLDARAENKTRKVKHDFAYTGLVHCGHCGCLMVGELKKGKYVYYHCTGNRGKCPERYTAQEKLTGEFASLLDGLVIPQPILDWMGGALLESDRTERAARRQSIDRLRARHEQIEARIETMYSDKLDGRITQEQFDRRSLECRREQQGILAKTQDIERAAPVPVGQAIDMMALMSRASELFLEQPAAEKRRLLQVVIEKATWKAASCRQRCSNRLKFCATRTRKVIQKKTTTQGQVAILRYGSSGRIRTHNLLVNSLPSN